MHILSHATADTMLTRYLSKTWFAYTLMLYTSILIALSTLRTQLCQTTLIPSSQSTRQNGTSSVTPRTLNQSMAATATFLVLSAITSIVWFIVHWRVRVKQADLSNVSSFISTATEHGGGAVSAEEALCVVIASFFTALVRLCMLIALIAYLSSCSGAARTSVAGFLLMVVMETLACVAFFYKTATASTDKGVL